MAGRFSAAISDSVSRRQRGVSRRKISAILQYVLMTVIRKRLSWVLASWLAFQLAGIVAPIALAAAHAAKTEVCTCAVLDHATCPMHHRQAPAREGGERCRMQNAATPSDAVFLSFTGGAGIAVAPAAFDAVDTRGDLIALTASDRSSRTELPDSPPPRA
jgi:hypothetical protein